MTSHEHPDHDTLLAAQVVALAREAYAVGVRMRKGEQLHARLEAMLVDLEASGPGWWRPLLPLLDADEELLCCWAATQLLGPCPRLAGPVLRELASGQGDAAINASFALSRCERGAGSAPLEPLTWSIILGRAYAVGLGFLASLLADAYRFVALVWDEGPSEPAPELGPRQRESLLEPYLAPIRAAARPALLLHPTRGGTVGTGCRFGGTALVPPGSAWPHADGLPLHFIGQLDFEDLANTRGEPLPGFPERGLLAFFFDAINQPWGEPGDEELWAVFFVPDPSDAVALDEPAFERPLPHPTALAPSTLESWPDLFDPRFPLDEESEPDPVIDAYIERQDARCGEWPTQVGGYPSWVQQGDDDKSRDEWVLLWQIGDSDGSSPYEWYGGGSLYLFVRRQDLAARRFDRCWCLVQCG